MSLRHPPEIDAEDLRVIFPPAADGGMHPGPIRMLSWKPIGGPSGAYDGVWRRHSRDVGVELGWLLPRVHRQLGTRVTRIGLPSAGWDGPRAARAWIDGSMVRLGWFDTLDPRVVTVTADRRLLALVVVDELPAAHPHAA